MGLINLIREQIHSQCKRTENIMSFQHFEETRSLKKEISDIKYITERMCGRLFSLIAEDIGSSVKSGDPNLKVIECLIKVYFDLRGWIEVDSIKNDWLSHLDYIARELWEKRLTEQLKKIYRQMSEEELTSKQSLLAYYWAKSAAWDSNPHDFSLSADLSYRPGYADSRIKAYPFASEKDFLLLQLKHKECVLGSELVLEDQDLMSTFSSKKARKIVDRLIELGADKKEIRRILSLHQEEMNGIKVRLENAIKEDSDPASYGYNLNKCRLSIISKSISEFDILDGRLA